MEKLRTVIPLMLQINKIDETHLQIHSIMIDLKNLLEAKEPERSDYKRVFMARSPLAIPRARYLSKHLLQVIPEINKNIIEKLADTSRCNLTALQDLQTEMNELMLNSLLIELTVLGTSKILSFSRINDFWQKQIADISPEIERIQHKCESKIPKLILEDMDECLNPKQLQMANKERYLWTWNDIFFMFYKDFLKFSAIDIREDKVFIQLSEEMIKIVTYGTNDLKKILFIKILLAILEKEDIYRLINPWEIRNRIIKGMYRRSVEYSAIFVYFNKNICGDSTFADTLMQEDKRWTITDNGRSCSARDGTTNKDTYGPLHIRKLFELTSTRLPSPFAPHCVPFGGTG
ncbi:uncharacterized protein LOC127861189 [Dreissena polymorpha]|uniref:uncharacterized protein LOC127861189 n=1 Tax=Dreissena polymorpha TaxID=45954 RepID=UPI0022651AEA|nr:uncharacterized protein LOC127861189 [Dreissena polymorpha]